MEEKSEERKRFPKTRLNIQFVSCFYAVIHIAPISELNEVIELTRRVHKEMQATLPSMSILA